MTNDELREQIAEKQALHIADIMHCLKKDPDAEDRIINYEETEEYLKELIEKDGSLLSGLISALETYLEK